ncbi:probable lysyl endopeptidase [Coccomyxa sp. Obi]|nr:probable lysyl endopeptidase [Coccomyxa sp. Obi]
MAQWSAFHQSEAFEASSDALPTSWEEVVTFQETDRDCPTRNLHLADVDDLLVKHEDHLGLHLRNTRFLAPQDAEAFDFFDKGCCARTPHGGLLCSLRIQSPGAAAHMLLFSSVHLAAGSELVIFSPDASVNFTKCQHSCMHITPADVHPSGKLTTVPIDGNEVMLMYHQIEGGAPSSEIRLLHVMQDVGDRLASAVHARNRRRQLLQERITTLPVGTQLPVDLIQQNSTSLFACTPSIECMPQYAHLADGIVAIYAVDPTSRTVGLCTGSIVTAPKGNRYLLTADHCIRDKGQLEGFEFWLLVFNYNAPCGFTSIPPIREVIQGLNLAYYDSHADVLMFAIPGRIPDHFHTYLLGFDAANEVPQAAVGIHHPGGAPTSISTVNGSGISTSFPKPNFPPNEVQPTEETHFQVTWTTGATIGGSSGSPLIDVANNRVVAVLTGGYSDCQHRTEPDYYGRLSVAWKHGLYEYLSSVQTLPVGDSFASLAHTRFMQANNSMPGRPVDHPELLMGMYPHVLHFYPNTTSQAITYYLLDPPKPNEVLTAHVQLLDLPGNAVDVRPYVNYGEGIYNFTIADYGVQFERHIYTIGLNETVPGGMLRFLIVVNVTSNMIPETFEIVTIKGIIQQAPETWQQHEPILVTSLPYFAEQPMQSPSGRAVFRFTSASFAAASFVDVVTCTSPLSDRLPLASGTTTAYRNGTFTWTLTPYNDPFGFKNCAFVPGWRSMQYDVYHVVITDVDDLTAALPISTVQQVYFGFSNGSIAASLLTS